MVHGLPHRSLVVVVEFGRTTWENPTYGDAKLKKAKYYFTVGSGSTAMGNGEYDTTFTLSKIWDDCKDLIAMIKEPQVWPSLQLKWRR